MQPHVWEDKTRERKKVYREMERETGELIGKGMERHVEGHSGA